MPSLVQRTLRYSREHAKWLAQYGAHAPKAGDPAPDFELRDVDGEHSVRLSDFHGKKPVVLVFGNFT